MTRDRDIERVLDRFYADGPTEMPDRLFLGVIDRIERVPQRRLAFRMTRFATMSSRLRLAAPAAIVVVVVGVTAFALSQRPTVGPQPSATASRPATASAETFQPVAVPASLQGNWVGPPRVVPQAPEPPYRLGLRISNADVQFDYADVGGTQFGSTAALVGPNQVRLRLGNPDGGCQPRDEGVYDFTVAADRSTMTLTPVTDQCQSRSIAIAGDWIRTACAQPQLWCLGDLAPGTHVSTLFTPLIDPTNWRYQYGALSYTVPAGWENTADDAVDFGLAPQDAPENTGMVIWNDIAAHAQAERCVTKPEPGVGRDATSIATWLTTLPGLVTSDPTPVSIDGLDGFIVDVSVAPTWTETCPYAYTTGLPLVSTFSSAGATGEGIDWNIQGEGRTRIVALDIGDGRALVINIEAQNKADYDALLPEAMQIVNSFTFDR